MKKNLLFHFLSASFVLFNSISCAQLFSWNKENFKQIDSKTASGNYIWLEGNGAFRFEEDTIIFLENGEVEVILNDLNGRGGMQVKLAEKASYWKYQKDINWNYMSAGTWNVKPTKKIYLNKKYRISQIENKKPSNKLDKTTKSKVSKSKPNKYKSVKIGTQTWMVQNLNVDKFRNGDPIPQAKTEAEWRKAGEEGKPACYYDTTDKKNLKLYGRVYNYYALQDPRGIAPEGWHIPSSSEWELLINYAGGEEIAGKKLKSTKYWSEVFSPKEVNGKWVDDYISGNGTDEFGFCGLPGGFRDSYGLFDFCGSGETWAGPCGTSFDSHWWSATPSQTFSLSYEFNSAGLGWTDNGMGHFIRCVKD
jgi:uncharacterized protein (TIGR02145 family)